MKQRIYRYIAIALAVAALLVAIIEVLIYGFPLFAFFFVAGAKDCYDSSIGKVTGGGHDNRPGFNPFANVYSPWDIDESYNTSAKYIRRGENPGGGTTDPFD